MEMDNVEQFLTKDTRMSRFEHSKDVDSKNLDRLYFTTSHGAELSQNNVDRPAQSLQHTDKKSSEQTITKCTILESKASKKSTGNLDSNTVGNRANVIGSLMCNNLKQTDSCAQRAVPGKAAKDSSNSGSDLMPENDLNKVRDKTHEDAHEHSFMMMNKNRHQENKEHLLCAYDNVENASVFVYSKMQDGTCHQNFESKSQNQCNPSDSVDICNTYFKTLKNTREVQTNELYGNFADNGNQTALKANHEIMETLSDNDFKNISCSVNNEMCLTNLPEVKVVLVDVMKMPIIQSLFCIDSTNDILQVQKKSRPQRFGDEEHITISGIDSITVSRKLAKAKNKGVNKKKAKEIIITKNKAMEQAISESEKTGQHLILNSLNEQCPNIFPRSSGQISMKRKVKTKSFLKESAHQKIMKELERVDEEKDVTKFDLNSENGNRTRKIDKSTYVLKMANQKDDHDQQKAALDGEEDVFEDSGEEYIISSEDEYLPSKEKKKLRVHCVNSFSRKRRPNRKPANCSSKINFVTTGKRMRIGRPPVLGLFYCKHCDFTATEKNLILKHHARVHVQPFLNCNYCNFTCRSRSVLMEHEARKHTNDKPFKCQVEGCEYASKCKTDLDRHQSKHATEKMHKCPHCDFTTKWRRNIRHHLMTHTTDRPFSCDICGFSFKRYQDLRYHLYRHSDEKPIKCDQCVFRCKTNFELRCHQLKHSDVRQFRCSFLGCTQMTKTKSDLTKHMKIHTTERNQKCPECGKGFKTIPAMKKHQQRVHTNERPYQCHICQKTFKIKIALRNHIRLHEGYKPFKCEVCGKDFANKSNMQCHLKTHSTEDRPFRCPICPYGAKIAHHLLAHIGSEHGDSYAYFCELCKKPFKRYGQLQTHYKRMHSKQELEKLGDLDPARLKVELKAEQKESSEDIKDNGEKAMGMDLLNCIKEEPSGADKDEMLEQVVAELEGSRTQTKSVTCSQREDAEHNKELQKEKKRRGRPKKKAIDKTSIDITVGSPIVLDEGSQDNQNSLLKLEGKISGSVIAQTGHNDIDQEDSDEKSQEKDANCNVDMKDDTYVVTKEHNHGTNEDKGGKPQIIGKCFDKIVSNHTQACNIETTNNERDTVSKLTEAGTFCQNGKDAITSNLEVKPLKEEMKSASINDDDKSSETSKPAATLAMYDGFRLPLATKGFEFNFEKTGKKPECWFMDPNLMNKKDAARHRAYLRKRGLTAAIIRNREKNRRSNPRQVALFTGFKSRHHDKYKTFDRKELMKKYLGRATDTMNNESIESLDKMNALKDERTQSKDSKHTTTAVNKKYNVTSVKMQRTHRSLKKTEAKKRNIIFETLDGKNLSEEQVQQSFPLLLSQSYLSEGSSTKQKKTKYVQAKKLKERKKRGLIIDGKTFKEIALDVPEKQRRNDNLIRKQSQKKKWKTKMSVEKGKKQNTSKRKEKKQSQSETHNEEKVGYDKFSIIQNIASLDVIDDDDENVPLSRLVTKKKKEQCSQPCQTLANGQTPDVIASDILKIRIKKRPCIKTKSRYIEAKKEAAKKGPKTLSGHGISEKIKIGGESRMQPKRRKLIKMQSDSSDVPKIIRTQKNGAKTNTKPSLKKLKQLKIKISLPSKKVLSSANKNKASKRKKASTRTKKGPHNTYFQNENSQYVIVYPPVVNSLESTNVNRDEGEGLKEKPAAGRQRSVKDQTQLVFLGSCIKQEPEGQFLSDSIDHQSSEPNSHIQSDQSQVSKDIIKAEVQSELTAVTYLYQAEEWRTVQNESIPAKSVQVETDVALDLSGYKPATVGCSIDISSSFGSLMDKAVPMDSLQKDPAQETPLDLSCKSSDNCSSRGDISRIRLAETNSSDFAAHELMQQQYSVVVKKEPDMEESVFTSVSGSQK